MDTQTAAWLYLYAKPHRDRAPRRSVFGLLVYCLRQLLDPRRQWTFQTSQNCDVTKAKEQPA